MAILWQKSIDSIKYEIRTAGQTRRLYTGGVCHSEYNPNKIITGSIWDLLMLPAYFYPVDKVQRILVLGVGGGAVIRQMLTLWGPGKIIGIEINPIHLYLSRRFYDIEHPNAELIEANAVDWLTHYSGPPFNLIIEDLFVGEKREPVRAVAAEDNWFRILLRHLHKNGTLVMNHVTKDEFNNSAYFNSNRVARRFKSAFRLSTPTLDNVVGVFVRKETSSSELRNRVMEVPLLRRAIQNKTLRYRIIKLNNA